MKLISEIEIKGFRSIRDCKITDLGDFTSFAGLNNSGKSNFLRALNAFFNNQTDEGKNLKVDDDYFRPDMRMKKAKQISVSVKFSLPDQFHFRSELEPVSNLLGGRDFTITKLWSRKEALPIYSLDGRELSLEDQQRINQFLQLINFRYVPNRVHPIDLIKREHQALRDVLVRRLGKRGTADESTFTAIQKTSSALIEGLANHLNQASPEIGSVRLATPNSWADMVFAFGYKLGMGGIELDDAVQGSGIQSLLMLETLYLIDRDYFQKFGWKQAAIWAVEEPESSLHTSLEALVALYMSSIASNSTSRLQILSTTHSDLILQYADKIILVKKENLETKCELIGSALDAINRLSREGISRWTHPLLHYPLEPLILVEGKYDADFLAEAFRILMVRKPPRISYIERLENAQATGGVDELYNYTKNNSKAIKSRQIIAPVVVVLDWDAASRTDKFSRLFDGADAFKIFAWPTSALNPKLGTSFRGIERAFSDRMIRTCENNGIQVFRTRTGLCSVERDQYGQIKKTLNQIVRDGLIEDDIVHAKPFIQKLVRVCSR